MLRFLRKGNESNSAKSNPPLSQESSMEASITESGSSKDRNAANNGKSSRPTTPVLRNKVRNIRNSLPSTPVSASTERQIHSSRLQDVVSKALTNDLDALKPFDSCIEASDALASTSMCSGGGVDNSTGLVNCSVLVSPDGELLITPQQKHSTEDGNEEEAQDKTWCWKSSTQSGELGEEYESAVFLGNDLNIQGDKKINGFSTKGWSIMATSLALKESADSMNELTHFLEDLILNKKMSAAQENQTLDKLRKITGVEQGGLTESKVENYQRYMLDKFSADRQRDKQIKIRRNNKLRNQQQNVILEVTSDRVGPLNYPGSSVLESLKALESYYSKVAEADSKRWSTLTKRSGALTKLRDAEKKTTDRVNGRQDVIQDTMRRIKVMEDYLRDCKVNAKGKWDKVHETEMKITRLVEEAMQKQNRIRQNERKKQIEQDVIRTKSEDGDSGALSSEIWHLVSEATASMEEGSFEPVVDLSDTNSSILTANSHGSAVLPKQNQDPFSASEQIELESDARYEFEVKYRLPELRVQAIAAEEAVEDAADSLLSVLSNWDKTKRSARLAAETCLVSSGNAQTSCLRSVIAVEKASIMERMKLLEELEKTVDKTDIRADLNEYIDIDKAKTNGRSFLGEDDDGGVASALKHLRGDLMSKTEVDALELTSVERDKSSDELDSDPSITAEYIEELLQSFFKQDSNLLSNASQGKAMQKSRDEFEAAVAKLSKIGEGTSTKAATRRSTISYAMNAQRSSNAEIPSLVQFEGLCRVFASVLTGCGKTKDSGISSAILLMGLADHFYTRKNDTDETAEKIFLKSRLVNHSLWNEDSFWDRALQHSINEKLNYSGVMSNFERNADKIVTAENKLRSEWTETKKTRWHDLSDAERNEAASQVNAVVYAQVSAMADTMLELCGNREQTSAFVRRVCVKNHLPVSQRSTLVRHLLRDDAIPNA